MAIDWFHRTRVEKERSSVFGENTHYYSPPVLLNHSLEFVIFILAHWNYNFQHWQKMVAWGLCNKLVLHSQLGSDKWIDENMGSGVIPRLLVPGPLWNKHHRRLSGRLESLLAILLSDGNCLFVLSGCLNLKRIGILKNNPNLYTFTMLCKIKQ